MRDLLAIAIAACVGCAAADPSPFCAYVRDDVNPSTPQLAGASRLAIDVEDRPIGAPDHEIARKLRVESGKVAAVENGLAARHFEDDVVTAFNRDFVAMLGSYADSMTRLAEASDRGDRAAWDSAIAQEKAARGKFSELGRTIIVRTHKACMP